MSKKSKSKAAKTSTKSKSATAAAKHDPDLVPLTKAMPKVRLGKVTKRKSTSGLDAAAMVLKGEGKPMRCTEMVERMLAKKLWATAGKTPAATIYSAIIREIQTKGSKARFRKTDRGTFSAANA
jgi:hypothetical protein